MKKAIRIFKNIKIHTEVGEMSAPLDPLPISTSPESSTLSRSVSGPNLNLGGDWGGELRDMERGGEFLNLWVGGVVDGLGGFVSSSCT